MCNNYSKTQKYFKHLLLHWQKNKNINKCMHTIITQILFPHHPFQILRFHKLISQTKNFRFCEDIAKLNYFTQNN